MWDYFFGIFLILALGLALQEAPAAQESFKPRPWSEVHYYRGYPIGEDPLGLQNFGQFIHPNEHENYLPLKCIPQRERGVLISVGTFRTLNIAAVRDFDAVFQIDYDFTVNAANEFILGLIRISNDNLEFLSYLFTGELRLDLINDAKNHKITGSDFLGRLETIANQEINTLELYYSRISKLPLNLPVPTPSYARMLAENHIIPQSIEGVNALLGQSLLHYLVNSASMLPFNRKLFSLDAFYKIFLDAYQYSYFGEAKYFKVIKALVDRGKIIVLPADLTGDRALTEISNVLKRVGQTVKVLDVSNAHSWILQDPNDPKRFKLNSYFRNLQNLPWSPSGSLLITDAPVSNQYTEDWKYFVLHHSFLEDFKNATFNPKAQPLPKELTYFKTQQGKYFFSPNSQAPKVYTPNPGQSCNYPFK